MMAVSTLLKSCATPPASLPDRLHLVALGELQLQRLLLGGIDGIEHGAFACARAGAERAHVDAPRQLALRPEGDLDGRGARAARDRPLQRLGKLAAGLLLAVGHEAGHRRRHAAALHGEHAHEGRVGGDDAAVGVGGGDAERRRLEDARQPHLGCGRALPRGSAPRCGRARARR